MISDADDFQNLLKDIEDVTLLRLKASTNTADGEWKQLSLKIGSSQVECDIPITRALEDKEAPSIKSVRYISESSLFVIEFTESVMGANKISAYKICNTAGEQMGIESVKVSDSDTQVEVKTKETLRNGKYTISFQGITDCSDEKNVLTEKKTIEVSGSVTTGNVWTWVIVATLLLTVVIVLVIVFLVVNSSKQKTQEEMDEVSQNLPQQSAAQVQVYQNTPVINEKHHIKAEKITRIRLQIKTGRTSEQNIETNLISSLIVGRSSVCDIYIDDTKLSRQHFVLESDGERLYVMDLQSRNGTTLNGIRVNSRQILHSGDKITAGLSDIYITILE